MTIKEFIENQPDSEKTVVFLSALPADGVLFDGIIKDLKQDPKLSRLSVRLYYWNGKNELTIIPDISRKAFLSWLCGVT